MARIDKLIETAVERSAEWLVLTDGKQATLIIGDKQETATDSVANESQLRSMLTEIAPDECREKVTEEGKHEFEYASPSGSVTVSSNRRGDSLRIRVTGFDKCAKPELKLVPPPPSKPEPLSRPKESPSPPPAEIELGGNGDRHPIETYLRKMVQEGSSDLHLSSEQPPLLRKDGDIVPLNGAPEHSAAEVRELILPIVPEKEKGVFETDHDIDFAYEIPEVARYRCNAFMDRLGMGGVFRVIPNKIPSAEDLGLPEPILRFCDLHKGLVIVTGPTGSGKSTTLAAMIDKINKSRPCHIITLEDPIEFVHPKGKCLINQREIGQHTRGFKQALRAALREDPDIVLLGEMRDLETVAIALETAETGHLVFATLHTNTAPASVDRIIDQFPPDQQSQIRVLLSESLKGIVAQTLCKRKAGGRVAALEVLVVNPAISNLIREGKTYQIPSLMQTGKGLGMKTLDNALLELVQAKVIELDEAHAKAPDKMTFNALLERHDIAPAMKAA